MRFFVLNYSYGMGSWGDEMILDGVLNGLGRENCVVHSWDPDETREMHRVEAVGWKDPWPEYDVMYIGGAGWGYHPHAGYIYRALLKAQESGKRTVIDAAGFWPLEDWKREAPVFKRVDEFTVRDPISQALVRRAFKRKPMIVPDPSQRMGITPMKVGKGPWVGINVANDAPLERLVPLCKQIIKHGYRLLGLATMAHKMADRLDVHAALRRLSDMIDYEILDPPGPWYKKSLRPRELAGLAQNCDKILAMRKHGCWLAQRVNKPLLIVNWYSEHSHPKRSCQQMAQLRPVIPHLGFCDLTRDDDPITRASGALLKDPSKAWMPELLPLAFGGQDKDEKEDEESE